MARGIFFADNTEAEKEIDAIAEDIIQFNTGGLCHLGKICDLCDCFLLDNIENDTRRHRDLAAHILAKVQERHG